MCARTAQIILLENIATTVAKNYTQKKTSMLNTVSWLLAFEKRRLYFDNTVFSIEINSFFILWGFLILPVILFFYNTITGNSLLTSENQTGVTIMFVMMLYTFVAARRFFNFSWWYSIIYAILYCFALVLFIEYIYKFILFSIAINLV